MKALNIAVVAAILARAGCASDASREELATAQALYHEVRDDAEVLELAPRDVIRAGESLERARRLGDYWGNGGDVEHYAYLSRRYSEIAREHGQLGRNRQTLERLTREERRLQQMLREARLLSVQRQSDWLDEQLERLATIETERGLVMTIGDVLFEPGSSELSSAANRTVLQLVQFLQLNPRRRVRIEGYTDNRGATEENRELSRLRAQSVARVLAELGIEASRIEVQGYGEAFPVAENASGRGRALNRRVEILFSDEQGRLGPQR